MPARPTACPGPVSRRDCGDLHPSALEAGTAALRAAEFDAVSCQIGTDPDQAQERIRGYLADGPFDLAMIGAGIRVNIDYTLLFERIVNVLTESRPGIELCFNTSLFQHIAGGHGGRCAALGSPVVG